MMLRTVIMGIGLTFLFAQAKTQNETKPNNAKYASAVMVNTDPDIVTLAAGIEDFSTLVTAVKAADLVSTLQGEGPFTVFAPDNAAFAKLPEGTVATLLKPENKSQLQKVLTYHVVAGKFMSEDVINAINSGNGSFTIETVSGDQLVASISNGSVILTDESGNKITVKDTDVKASNGVVHVINGVLLPK